MLWPMSSAGPLPVVAALALVAACGGNVVSYGGDAGTQSGSGGAAGGMGNAGSTAAGGATASGGSTGAGGDVPGVTCQAVCDRVATLGCPNNEDIRKCGEECLQLRAEHPECIPQLDQFIACVMNATIVCRPTGETEILSCDATSDAFQTCLDRNPTPSPPPPPLDAGPGAACPVVAAPPGGRQCSGGTSGGGSSGGGTAGGQPVPTCSSSCTSADGTTWSANCQGTNCTCFYNGAFLCQCVAPTECGSCCPGL
jgi:hypothetical protein